MSIFFGNLFEGFVEGATSNELSVLEGVAKQAKKDYDNAKKAYDNAKKAYEKSVKTYGDANFNIVAPIVTGSIITVDGGFTINSGV
jgi:hypothetical protein